VSAPTYSYVAYIDEAGDEGFKFKNKDGSKGSTEWFVLSGVVIRSEHDVATTKLVDEVRAKISKSPKTVLHFKDLQHKQRVPYIDTIAKANLRISTVMLHKHPRLPGTASKTANASTSMRVACFLSGSLGTAAMRRRRPVTARC
jgi:hypothetical protein